ncbi:MAG: hypothetical protein ACXABY_30910 [Candidatus Thorarchaeota archaeon]
MSDFQEKVRKGTWSVAGDKLRITYSDGVESVLFEDTASVSFQSSGLEDILRKYVLYLCAVFSILMSIKLFIEGDSGVLIGILLGGAFWFAGTLQPGFHDVVSIETVGGKVLRFRSAHGSGAETMELIEEAKRNWLRS